MKNLIVLFLSAFVGLGTLNAQTVGSDIKLGEPIKKFKTYAWASEINQIPSDKVFIGPNGVFVFNNETSKSKIKNSIQYELAARGFKMDATKPDMLINFIVFEQEGQLRTYNGYQTVMGGLDSVRTEDNIEMVTVKPGTLFITIIGNKNEGVVWQGYASGILSAESVKDDAKVKAAVAAIFNEFGYKAFKD